LEEIKTHKGGKQKPLAAYKVSQNKANQDKKTSKSPQSSF